MTVVHTATKDMASHCKRADILIVALLSDEHLPVNIGNPVEMTLLEFAAKINDVVGNRAGITFVPEARSDRDPQRRQPDITRAREKLGWNPAFSLEEGIRLTIPYFKQQLRLDAAMAGQAGLVEDMDKVAADLNRAFTAK